MEAKAIRALSEKTFILMHKGKKMKVVETIWDKGAGARTLVWCRYPFYEMVVDSFNNYLFYTSYRHEEEGARLVVKEAFINYYSQRQFVSLWMADPDQKDLLRRRG